MKEPCVSTRAILTLVTLHPTSQPRIRTYMAWWSLTRRLLEAMLNKSTISRGSLRKIIEREMNVVSLLKITGSRERIYDGEGWFYRQERMENKRKLEKEEQKAACIYGVRNIP